jgi:hypothetical protein
MLHASRIVQPLIKRSGTKTLATLGTPRVDDRTATAGLHARTKTVSARTLQITGLESALHEISNKARQKGAEW